MQQRIESCPLVGILRPRGGEGAIVRRLHKVFGALGRLYLDFAAQLAAVAMQGVLGLWRDGALLAVRMLLLAVAEDELIQ
jgi:hypothetical protein